MPDADRAEVPHTIGRYTLFGEIASGGMATVHYGHMVGSVGFTRTVAIKRLHREYARDPEFVAMFLDEARLAARVRHPNVIQTLDVISADGLLFLVMEYVHGVSLSQLWRLASTGSIPTPPAVTCAIMSGVLHGLHAAHEATDEEGNPLDIVHRDVSPQNVMVGADGVARVFDFGVAKASGGQHSTREGQIKGKLAYMAPEQITSVALTRRADIFAASVVLWELLVGKRLFAASTADGILAKVLGGRVDPPGVVVPELAPFDAVVMRGLDRNPQHRFATALEMARALEGCMRPASPSDVTEWVALLAQDELTARRDRVAEMETLWRADRVSVNSLLEEGVTQVREAGGGTRSDRPSVQTARDGLQESETQIATSSTFEVPRRRAWVPLALTAAAVGLGLGGLIALRAPSAPAPSSAPAAAPASPATGSSTSTAAASATASPTELPADDVPTAPSASVAVGSVNARPRRPPQAPTDRTSSDLVRDFPSDSKRISAGSPASASPAPSATAAPPAADCSPPYTVDADNHRHYKPECFR